jgi:hypothetical protein
MPCGTACYKKGSRLRTLHWRVEPSWARQTSKQLIRPRVLYYTMIPWKHHGSVPHSTQHTPPHLCTKSTLLWEASCTPPWREWESMFAPRAPRKRKMKAINTSTYACTCVTLTGSASKAWQAGIPILLYQVRDDRYYERHWHRAQRPNQCTLDRYGRKFITPI